MRWLPYLIIAFVSILFYFPTFTGEFILDDRPLIEKNPYITELHTIKSYLAQEDGVTDKTLQPEDYHTGYYRPLINISYWLDYKLWGMSAPNFRMTNLFLHILCCVVLFHFLLLLTKNRNLAMLTACLFAVHPVNTESVSWVTSRNNILATLFALLAHCVYIKARVKKNFLLLLLSALLFGGALFSKEFGIMLLPILLLFQRIMAKNLSSLRSDAESLIPFFLILICYLIFRQSATSSLVSPEDIKNIGTKIYFIPYILALNLKMVIFPFELHSFIIKYPNSYLSWEAVLGFGSLILVFCLVVKFRPNRLFVYAVLCFFVGLFPVLNVIPTSAVSLISMRWLYFPMAFFSTALVALLKGPMETKKHLTVTILAFLILYMGIYTYVLNRGLWHDEETFFSQELQRFDNTYYAYGYALRQHKKLGDFQKADRYFKIAIGGYHSQHAKPLIDYSMLLNETGRYKDAIFYLNKADITNLPSKEKGEWYNSMGTAAFYLNDPTKALMYFRLAVEIYPIGVMNWSNLGAAYGTLGMYHEATEALERGLELDQDSLELKKNLAVTYIRMENYAKALEVLSKIGKDDIESNPEIRKLIDGIKHNLLIDSANYGWGN